MATLWLTEYRRVASHDYGGGSVPIASEPGVDQTVTFTTSVASAAFRAETRVVRLVSDADCHVKFGDSPTATTSMQKMIADVEYWREVRPGAKVAAVTAA